MARRRYSAGSTNLNLFNNRGLVGRLFGRQPTALVGDANIYDPQGRVVSNTLRTPLRSPSPSNTYIRDTGQPVSVRDGRFYVSGVQGPVQGPVRPDTPAGDGVDQQNLLASGAGGDSLIEPNIVEYPPGSGYYYDLNNDEQRTAFYTAKMNDLVASRDQQLASIDQEIADLQTEAGGYAQNYFRNVENLGKVKGTGDTARINVFSQASPNAFQSAEATSYDLSNNAYLRGLAEGAQQAQAAVGGEFLTNPTDYSRLGAESIYGRNIANQNLARNEIGEQFNLFREGILQQADPSTSPYQFAYQANQQPLPGAVDLSGYNAFVDFRNIPGPATPGPGFTPRTPSQFTEGTNLDAFLGRDARNLDQRDRDILRDYLLGRRS